MAFCFFIVLICIHSLVVPFLPFYHTVIHTQEFFFRGETTFFYKGFIYLCIGFLFVYFTSKRYRFALLTILGLAIVLTFTRGFVFALAATFLLLGIMQRTFVSAAIAAVIVLSTVLYAKPFIYEVSTTIHSVKAMDQGVPKEKLLGNREESDVGRVLQAKEVLARITPLSLLVGHGFGNGVPSRPIHMEVSYLEIFHKQGLIGLLIWLYLMILLWQNYRRSANVYQPAFFFGSCFVFIQSITNQFINNPIGLSFVILSLVILNKNSAKEKERISDASKLRLQKGDEIALTSV